MGLEATRGFETTEGEVNVEISIEEIYAVLGPNEAREFLDVMAIVQDIIDFPERYSGLKALVTATKLAAVRTKIGQRAQFYKTSDKTISTRKRKDLLMAMYSGLEENINTLKLQGKSDVHLYGGGS